PPHLTSFPTRRSSDLVAPDRDCPRDHREGKDCGIAADPGPAIDVRITRIDDAHSLGHPLVLDPFLHDGMRLRQVLPGVDTEDVRSEEHTSELQSLRHL